MTTADDDSVVGVFDRERLPAALTALHRAGFGPNARVLDRARGDLPGQAQRLGLNGDVPIDETVETLLFVYAPARTVKAGEVLQQHGARSLHRSRLGTPPALTQVRTLANLPSKRAGRGRPIRPLTTPPTAGGEAAGG